MKQARARDMTGKVVVVTGASKGIGAEIARAFGAAGASVVVNYSSSREGADRVVADITKQDGKAVAIQGNVSKSADIKRLFAETKKAFGGLDVLVNNAGVFQFDPLENVTEAEFHRQFDTNVLGLILTTQEAAKHFGPKGGSVVNISSAVSRLSMPASVVYTATKAAVDAVTRVLAKELGPKKIRVNSINPGGVETEGTHTAGIAGGEMEKAMVAQTALGRFGRPDDIAPVALFLASEDSGWITGESLVVSGGFG